jgi:hypothetical protein
METYLFRPANTKHRTASVGGTPSTLKALGFIPEGVGDKVYVLQPTGGDVRFTINPGDGPVVGQRGLLLKDGKVAVFSFDEIVESQWVSDTGKAVTLQIYTAIDRAVK